MACLMAVCLFCIPAFAETTNVVFDGNAEDFVDMNGSTDLFENFKGMMPGDTATQTITLTNRSESTLRFYLKAEILKQLGVGGAFNLDIVCDGEALYSGILGGRDAEGNAQEIDSEYEGSTVLLTTLGPNETADLSLTLTINGEGFGNENQNTDGAYRFTFSVEDVEGGTTVVPTPAPSAPAESGNNPKTGDTNTIYILIAALAVCVVVLVILVLVKRKHRDSEESK